MVLSLAYNCLITKTVRSSNMNDWNQNGKRDSGDKAIFHTEVSGSDEQKNIPATNLNDGEYSILVDWIINGVCALILFFIFGAEIEINSFTAIVSLTCLVKIGWSLFVWFINATSR